MKVDEDAVELKQWLAQRPAWVPTVLLILGPLIASGVWSFESMKSRLISITFGIVMIAVGGLITHLREKAAQANETTRQ